jgi:hypothetical protein
MISFTVAILRTLKGAPLSIVIALALSPTRVGNEYLARVTGYTDKTVAQALNYLAEIQLINRTSSGWGLAAGFQLPLMIPGSVAAAAEVESESEKFRLDDLSRKNSDSIDTTTTTAINLNINNDLRVAVAAEVESESEKFRLNHELLLAYGIGEPTASRIARHAWIDAEYIKDIAYDLKKRGKSGPGLLIVKLENNEEPTYHRSDSRYEYREWGE